MMMEPLLRLGDTSSHGGSMISATSVHLTADGIAVCVNGDSHNCPLLGHGVTPVAATSKHTSGGKKLARVGDVAGCGAVMTTGSPTVESN